MRDRDQLLLDFRPSWRDCDHSDGFETNAFIPSGVFCSDCDTLILQFIPQSPERIGYASADWVWHHRDGKPWTTEMKQ